MGMRSHLVLGAVLFTAMVSIGASAANAPAAPQPVPAPSPVKGGGVQQPQTQPGQQQRQAYRRSTPKLRKGNSPQGSGDSKKKADEELVIAGAIAEVEGGSGDPDSFTITGEDGKGYTLKGREASLKKLVGKQVEIEGELEEKDGKTVLKVKSIHETKDAKPEAKKSDKKT